MKVELIDHMGSDLSVVNAARVSFAKKHEEMKDNDEGLIKYLAKHNHISPFHHAFITMHVKAPIFVARQLVKHKFMPWNEVSRRYVDNDPEFYEPKTLRKRAEDKKQGSSMVHKQTVNGVSVSNLLDVHGAHALGLYKAMINDGVAPEEARMVLPLNTYTEWYWSGTLSAWAAMYNLRIKPDTQEETRLIAKQCGKLIEPLFPVSWKALTK